MTIVRSSSPVMQAQVGSGGLTDRHDPDVQLVSPGLGHAVEELAVDFVRPLQERGLVARQTVVFDRDDERAIGENDPTVITFLIVTGRSSDHRRCLSSTALATALSFRPGAWPAKTTLFTSRSRQDSGV
jgi:hypothetical protein